MPAAPIRRLPGAASAIVALAALATLTTLAGCAGPAPETAVAVPPTELPRAAVAAPAPIAEPRPAPAPRVAPPQPAPVAPAPAPEARMTIGDAQRKLIDLGYKPGPTDGLWGPRTAAALREFQRDQKLRQSGQLDAETQEKLRAAPAR